MFKLKNYFITGLISITPIFLTIFILLKMSEYTIKLFSQMFSVNQLREIIIKNLEIENKFFNQMIVSAILYGIAFIIVYLIIIIIGVAVSKFINKEKVKYWENIFLKIPFVKPIYTTIKQIREIVFSKSEKAYKKVVLIEYPRKGMYCLAFLTNAGSKYFKDIYSEEVVNVFVPTSPNPTSGMFLIVPTEEVIELDIKIEDAIKLIISGGAIIPDNFAKKEKERIRNEKENI